MVRQNVFVHPNAIVEEGARIGRQTRVWAFTHILSGAVVGEDCNICDHVFLENDVRIGDRVTLKSGVQLWDGVTLEDDVFIGPSATFTNDPFPRSKQHLEEFERIVIRQGASVGANATILSGIEVGPYAMVGAGAVVTRDVPAYAVVVGNPARITGYVDTHSPERLSPHRANDVIGKLSVDEARLIELPRITDLRGDLSVAEYGKQLPFRPKRYFVVFNVSSKEVRGEHAHRTLKQFLVCLNGSCSVVVDDGEHRDEITLDQPDIGLYIPPMIWATQYKYTTGAILLVLASDVYDTDDYIRNYDEYLRLVRK